MEQNGAVRSYTTGNKIGKWGHEVGYPAFAMAMHEVMEHSLRQDGLREASDLIVTFHLFFLPDPM